MFCPLKQTDVRQQYRWSADRCLWPQEPTWRRILYAIERLQAKAQAEGEKVH